MKIGLLLFDDDKKRTLAEKIDLAVSYYQKKYGRDPDTCYVNPNELNAKEGGKVRIGKITLRPNITIIKNHFWLGVDGDK